MAGVLWPSTDHFYRQGMQPLVDKILQRIIHKPMALHTGHLPSNCGADDTDPEMGAEAGVVGTGMAGMLVAFVQHLQRGGRQPLAQALLDGAVGRSGAPWRSALAPGSGFATLEVRRDVKALADDEGQREHIAPELEVDPGLGAEIQRPHSR